MNPMRKRTIWSMVATIAVAILVCAMVPMSMAQLGDGDNRAQPVNDQFGSIAIGDNETTNLEDLADKIEAMDLPLFGPFNMTDDNVTGKYVSFMVGPDSGMISNYTLRTDGDEVLMFNNISATGLTADGSTDGPLWMVNNDTFGMTVHNNPEGTIHIGSTENASVNMTMPRDSRPWPYSPPSLTSAPGRSPATESPSC